MKEQIIIQDILKHLAVCEHEDKSVSHHSLAVELSMPLGQVERYLTDLEAAELIVPGSMKLTESGSEYALHVLRAHRLYETYLANKTGVHESQWHVQAHIEEHKFSADDVERWDRELDYPLYDPHGDPIPSASGEMPPKRGRPLTDHPVGWAGKVVHVEDEPTHLYALITAACIAPGTVLRIEEKDDESLSVFLEGREFCFPLDVASNITVEPLAESDAFDPSVERLSALAEGEHASVLRLSPLCMGLERSRLLDLGIVPGTEVSVDLVSPSGTPIAYRIRGASIALRQEQGERVLIRKEKETIHA